MFGLFGELHPAYGYRHSEETKARIALASKNRARTGNWGHPDRGVFLNVTISDLIEMFPEDDIKLKSMCRVRSGERKRHKGWYYISDADMGR